MQVIECKCQMGMVMKADNSSCIVPPPTTPTPRPVPTMKPELKQVTGGISKGASTLIIVFLSITLLLFLIFRIFTPSRVIHMCEEVIIFAIKNLLSQIFSYFTGKCKAAETSPLIKKLILILPVVSAVCSRVYDTNLV